MVELIYLGGKNLFTDRERRFEFFLHHPQGGVGHIVGGVHLESSRIRFRSDLAGCFHQDHLWICWGDDGHHMEPVSNIEPVNVIMNRTFYPSAPKTGQLRTKNGTKMIMQTWDPIQADQDPGLQASSARLAVAIATSGTQGRISVERID